MTEWTTGEDALSDLPRLFSLASRAGLALDLDTGRV